MLETWNNVKNVILEILKFNWYISEEQKIDIWNINQIEEFLSELNRILDWKYDLIKEYCIEEKLFTQDEYDIFLRTPEEEKNDSDSILEKLSQDELYSEEQYNSTIDQEKNIEELVGDTFQEKEKEFIEIKSLKEETEEPEGKVEEEKLVKLSQNEINDLIKNWENLYKKVLGNQVPREDNIFYAKVQLYRFIDSRASDFILETQKRDWKIQYKVIFKIDGENELQDSSNWARPEDNSSSNDNLFFESVRRWIGSNKWRINADLKHVMQDGSFSLEYKWWIRDFRLNSMPTRCYWVAYPRYVIRLATEWDNCDFDSIKMLPHAKKLYEEMINNKIAWTILITGPTGSWKTTTIYSLLNKVDKNRSSYLSVEKPIESQLYGINQTETDAIERDDKKERYTNMEALKWILRQALDGVFIWEMRDSVEIIEGINTWLVGNKLITTLHTNSWVDTILRLITEWVNTNAIWNWIKYITAQRLVNELCPHCSIEDPNKKDYLKKISKSFKRAQIFFHREFKRILQDIPEDEFTLDDIELSIQEKLTFTYWEDKEKILSEIEKNIRKIDKCKTKQEKIDLILDITKDYPYPDFRKEELLKRVDQQNLKTVNEKWCAHCRWWYSWRIMILEILKMDKAIKSFIHKDIKLNELENFLLNRGHITMEIYGYMLALDWIISVEKLKEFVED